MAQVNAGRVRFIGRGEYDNSTQYYTFDLVNYNGNSYFAKSNTMGNLPTNSTYWQLVAEKGSVGPAGPTGNGIDHISLTSQSGATKVYTIYFTDGNTTTFTVQDGEVTQEVFDEEVERLKMVYNAMPKVSGEGTDLTLDNTAECPVYDIELSPSELSQEADPTPDNPQQIHKVSGENTVVVGNKNLVDTSIIETGNIDTTTGEESYGIFKITKDFIKVTPNETYSFQYVTTATGKQIVIYEYGASQNYTGFKVISATSGSQVLSSTTEYIKIRFSSATNSQPVDISNVQVEKSSTVTDYEEHKEQTYSISLGDLEYCKIGDYEDLFFKNVVGSEYYDSTLVEDKWYLKKNIGKTTDTIGSTSKTISDMVSNATVYSYCGGTVSGTTITYTSALVFANYIYYPTTTPTNILLSNTLQTQLDNIQKAITHQDQTNVSQTNADLPFVIKLSAIRDLSGIFELISQSEEI